jgi:hypothetical protein
VCFYLKHSRSANISFTFPPIIFFSFHEQEAVFKLEPMAALKAISTFSLHFFIFDTKLFLMQYYVRSSADMFATLSSLLIPIAPLLYLRKICNWDSACLTAAVCMGVLRYIISPISPPCPSHLCFTYFAVTISCPLTILCCFLAQAPCGFTADHLSEAPRMRP